MFCWNCMNFVVQIFIWTVKFFEVPGVKKMFGCSSLFFCQNMIRCVHSTINRCLGYQLWRPNGDETNKHLQKDGPHSIRRLKILFSPPKLAWNIWNLKMDPLKSRFLLETIIFRFQVNFRGSNGLHFSKTLSRSQLFRDVLVALEKWKRFVSCHKFLGVYNSPWSEWVYMGGYIEGHGHLVVQRNSFYVGLISMCLLL